MDILQQQYNSNNKNKNEKSNLQKLVLKLIIVSIILFIILLGILLFIKSKPVQKDLSLVIDGQNIDITPTLIIEDNEGNKYVSLEEIAELVGYEHYNGSLVEITENTEDKTMCYLESKDQIVGFKQNTNSIYKSDVGSDKDYKYSTLAKKITNTNDDLYISLEDIQKALDIYVKYDQKENMIKMNTLEYLSNEYATTLQTEKPEYTINNIPFNNNKVLLQNMIIITNESKVGIINTNLETLVGAKYKSLEYEDYTKNFIAVNTNNKYGIISKEGKIIVEFLYDGIEILNYNPVLYKVKKNNYYGVLDETGKTITEIKYTELGTKADIAKDREAALIIEKVNDKDTGLVVNEQGKYGIVEIISGKEIVPCELSNVYAKTNTKTKEKIYYVEVNNIEYKLKEYLEILNTITVEM